MTLTFRPEIQDFIENQVRAGNYPSAEAMVEAAIEQLQASVVQLTDEDNAAIQRADEEAIRGEGMNLETFRTHISKRFITA